jgi:Domain of unknown function (DUF5916)
MKTLSPRICGFTLLFLLACSAVSAEDLTSLSANGIVVPRLERAPTLEDFGEMQPSPAMAAMVKAGHFLQRNPRDGEPASQKTDAYLGYDARNFYVMFVCFQKQEDLRARLSHREEMDADDSVELLLDTFNDRRRAYVYTVNPRGVQGDGLWTEGKEINLSYDAIWGSKAKITSQGFIALISVPFKSLRFPNTPEQKWRIMLHRFMPTTSEDSYWPQYTTRIEGRLNQTAEISGLREISPGRNMQFIPYALFRSYRAPDLRDATNPRFASKDFKGDIGGDAKFIIKDSLVLDLTGNPDFSQIESDEPQITVNQRFEVYFPEKRPFFLENSNYFDTAVNYVFTRRIANPDFGARLTGKVAKNSVGLFVVDDRSPGLLLPPHDPLSDSRALFAIGRYSRDIGSQSTLGFLYTDREYEGMWNRVGGADARIKLNPNWIATAQGVLSSTRTATSYLAGPSLHAAVARSGRQFNYQAVYDDTAAGFVTETGFFRRPNYRGIDQTCSWKFYPNSHTLLSHGPQVEVLRAWDHQGLSVNTDQTVSYRFDLPRTTWIIAAAGYGTQGLSPDEYPSLVSNKQFSNAHYRIQYNSDVIPWLGIYVMSYVSRQVNFVSPAAVPPQSLNQFDSYVGLWWRPTKSIKIVQTYLYSRGFEPISDQVAITNHISRTSFNWQFTPALSLRLIGEYSSLLPSSTLTTLKPTKSFNADFLLTYLVHPGTAVYLGYNSNLQNLTPNLALDPDGSLARTRNSFINDGKQFFMKVSYTFR